MYFFGMDFSATTTKTIAFSSGSPQGSQGFITFIVQDNRQFQVTPVAEYTVTLSVPGNSRVSVGSTEMTGVTIDDDDGMFKCTILQWPSVNFAYFCADVTVIIPGSMTYDEGDSDIRVCAQLTSPSGGLAVGQSVTVTFTADGKQPGTSVYSLYIDLLHAITLCFNTQWMSPFSQDPYVSTVSLTLLLMMMCMRVVQFKHSV